MHGLVTELVYWVNVTDKKALIEILYFYIIRFIRNGGRDDVFGRGRKPVELKIYFQNI